MYEKIKKLADLKEVTIYKISKDIGIPQTNFSAWKNGRNKPSAEALQKIADYFGVSVGYFFDELPEELEKPFNPQLNAKDEKDIAKRLDNILEGMESDGLMFNGQPMTEKTKEVLRKSLQNSLEMGKLIAKEKYTPKKYRGKEKCE